VCDVAIGACVGCLSDGDCKTQGAPRCDVRTNTCVECLPAGDNCGFATFCAGTRCMPGCKADPDCAGGTAPTPVGRTHARKPGRVHPDDVDAGTDDGGTGTDDGGGGTDDASVPDLAMGPDLSSPPDLGPPGGGSCLVTTHQCVQCTTDAQCGLGQVCTNNACVPGCSAQHACPGGQGCCAGHCASLSTDGANCGQCGNPCSPGQSCCGGVCTAISTNASCGGCGLACGSGQDCCAAGGTFACFGVLDDALNCGACGRACPMGQGCCGGACVPFGTLSNCGGCGKTCAAGADCCSPDGVNYACTSLAGDDKNCGACGRQCGAGTSCCGGGTCVAVNTNVNCGACGTVCGAGTSCCGGKCIPVTGDNANCGGCGITCSAGSACCGSTCTPTATRNNCGGCGVVCATNSDCCASSSGGVSCTSLLTTQNCGACGNVCVLANATPICIGGSCAIQACTAPYADCDKAPANGCESDLLTDVNNCGTCGRVCVIANGTAKCVSGTCQVASCTAPYADCDGDPTNGCEANTATDAQHCGGCAPCGAVANGAAGCSGGQCVIASCTAPFTNCDGVFASGCNVNTSSDSSHCGNCATACTSGQTCTNGTCATSNSSCTPPAGACFQSGSMYCCPFAYMACSTRPDLIGPPSPFTCPTGAAMWCDTVPISPTNAAQAQKACQACFGGACAVQNGDCAGPGYSQSGSGGPTFGYQGGGCSGEAAGHIWQYGTSYQSFGTWAE
jgi:hypothetical protein